MANLIEFRLIVEGEVGVVAEKIVNDFCREGSKKEGEEIGLPRERGSEEGGVMEVRDGKSTREVRGGTTIISEGFNRAKGSTSEES